MMMMKRKSGHILILIGCFDSMLLLIYRNGLHLIVAMIADFHADNFYSEDWWMTSHDIVFVVVFVVFFQCDGGEKKAHCSQILMVWWDPAGQAKG